MTVVVVPHSREHTEGRFDIVGSVLSAVAVGALVLAIHEGPEVGWTEPLTAARPGRRRRRRHRLRRLGAAPDHPLLDLRVFRNRMLTVGLGQPADRLRAS